LYVGPWNEQRARDVAAVMGGGVGDDRQASGRSHNELSWLLVAAIVAVLLLLTSQFVGL
jgi:hypothetical protein